MSSFMDKVQAVENKFMDLEQQISDPSVIARQDEWQKLTKEHASLMPIVETFRKYKDITSTIDGDKEIIDDPDSDDDLIAMAKEEMNGLTKEQADLEEQLHILMLPKDPRDDKNVIMEIRAGAGGDEASLQGQPIQSLFGSEQSYRDFSLRIVQALKQGEPVRDVWTLRRPDGTPFEARMAGRSVQLAGCERGSIWVIENVTEARRASPL